MAKFCLVLLLSASVAIIAVLAQKEEKTTINTNINTKNQQKYLLRPPHHHHDKQEEEHNNSKSSNNHNCCLCNDCDMMMNTGTDLYDLDQQEFVSCQDFAEAIYSTFNAGSDSCNTIQKRFQTLCCLVTASTTMTTTSTTSMTSQDRRRRQVLEGTGWTIKSPTTGTTTTSLSTVPFQSSSLTTPQSPPAYTNWAAAQQSAELADPPANTATTTWAMAPASPSTTVGSSSGSCSPVSGGCDFQCPSVPADRLTIHVTFDPSAAGRSDLPYFSASCGNVQNQMYCQRMLSSDLRCSLIVARFRAECGCGGHQNNAAAFYGGVTPSNGQLGWRIGG